MRPAVLSLLFLAVLGCSSAHRLPAPPAEISFDTLVVPGERIGPVYVGMTGSQLLKSAGEPMSAVRPCKDCPTATRFLNGIRASIREADMRVIQVTTGDGRYKTKEGLGPGSSELAVRSAYGMPRKVVQADFEKSQPYNLLYYKGLWFAIDPPIGRVIDVGVAP
jgi:hypothetical protein